MRQHLRTPVSGALVALVVVGASACAATGSPVASQNPQSSEQTTTTTSPLPTIRQTDDAGNRLPFPNDFPDRWSEGNDGTTYEPCTAFTDEELTNFGIDPQSVRDAAGANRQTLRGCNWSYVDTRNTFSQIVGNERSLENYKDLNRDFITWGPDLTIAGRTVAIGPETSFSTSCSTYFMSGSAIVITSIYMNDVNPPPTDEICQRAIAFTELTIGRTPE